MKKNLTAICLSAVLLAGTAFMPANADNSVKLPGRSEETHHCYGAIMTDEQILIDHAYVENDAQSEKQLLERAAMPKSTDLSTSPFFPPIGDQGHRGTCAAFATTYYQFTYEYNRLNRTPVSQSGFIASPQWTYSHIVGDSCGSGARVNDIYDVLKYTGANSLTDVPYDKSDKQSSWPNDFSLSAKAAEKRLKSWNTIKIQSSESPITSPNSEALDQIKKRLINGNVLEVDSDCTFTIVSSADYGSIITRIGRTYDKDGNHSLHAMTIVGYNDNVCFDVNGDGVISDSEKGAFKLANSWGTNWANDGYVWVLYDTVNNVSHIPGNWQSAYNNERKAAFTCGSNYAYFKFITVTNDTPYIFGNLNITTHSMSEVGIYTTIQDKNATGSAPIKRTAFCGIGHDASFGGTVVFPYLDIDDIGTSITGKKWGFMLKDTKDDDKVILNRSFYLSDNLGRKISETKSFGNIINNGSYSYSTDVELIKGDVDYNSDISGNDSLLVLQYTIGNYELSNLQKFLADVNNDGVVDASDAQAILNISTQNAQKETVTI